MKFKGKFWIAALICLTALSVSGLSSFKKRKDSIVQQTSLITVNSKLVNQIRIVAKENVILEKKIDSVSVDTISPVPASKVDTLFVKVIGENKVLIKFNGHDIKELGQAIAKALKSDTTASKVTINLIDKRRK